ncbi:MAG: lysophospholipid acyltransferase family protein [Bacteroidales bacterium]|nr:lysophospholipid acyltransferase family protein [Bacteroidales bacterium]
MGKIAFYLFFIITRIMTLLPLKGMFVISDIARLFIYHIFRYRVKTVRTNLRNSFPEKSSKELKRIEKAFYKHLCDLFIETIYILHANKKDFIKMCKFNNIELFYDFYDKGKSVIVATGHYSNWELLGLFAYHNKHFTIGIYKPMKNKYFEKFLNSSRERFGAASVPMQDTLRAAIKCTNEKRLFFLGLVCDQTPSDIHYWTTFLNQDTPVFLGVEKISRKLNQPVIFCSMRKVARGRYEVELETLCAEPLQTKPYEITEMHVHALEKLIYEAPEYWLWSHRRWKHRKPADYKHEQTV